MANLKQSRKPNGKSDPVLFKKNIVAQETTMSNLRLDVDQAGELKAALRREGPWTNEELKMACERKGFFTQVRQILLGNAEIKENEFFRTTGELTLQIPALARPTFKQLQTALSWIEKIERDTSPTEAVTFTLATALPVGEKNSISGTEYERRIAPKQDLILGYQQAVWLVEHQDELPGFTALLGKIYIDFSGLVVVSGYGYRYVPYLSPYGKRWFLFWDWLGYDFYSSGRIASSSK
jgi:hypothetical protein